MYDRLHGGGAAAQLVMAGRPEDSTDAGALLEVWVDGAAATVPAGASLLDACDVAGHYLPRLCFHPLAGPWASDGPWEGACGLCSVRLGDGSVVSACSTPADDGIRVTTDDPGLRAGRLERLAGILACHPHVCLSCPDRDGCARDQCTYGHPAEARCCDEFGHCELGRLVAFLDSELALQRRPVTVPRAATVEGPVRREPGLCIGCGRCVRVCTTASGAGKALELARVDTAWTARPKAGTLRASGCTFCGLCVMVCPAGAVTAPGEAGSRWLERRRAECGPISTIVPPEPRQSPMLLAQSEVARAPAVAGVMVLYDGDAEIVRIAGVPDLRQGLQQALCGAADSGAIRFHIEQDPLYTQRETELLARYASAHGHLPAGDDLDDELYDNDF